MKSRGGRFLMLLGAGLAALAFVVVYLFMSKGSLVVAGNQAASSVPTPLPVRQVAVVSRDVPAYTVLDASAVTLQDVDATTVVSGSTSEPSVLVGKMTLQPLTKGEQIQTSQLTASGFSNVIEKGKKAFTLAVEPRNTFGGALTEGDHIDILWSATLKISYVIAPDGTTKEVSEMVTSTKTLLQDITVLRVIQLQPAVPPKQSGDTQADPAAATTATRTNPQTVGMYTSDASINTALILAVTDQQAEVLKFARENGTMDMTLRSSAVQKDADGNDVKGADGKAVLGDHENEKTTGVTIQTLIDGYGLIPVPQIKRLDGK